MLDTRPLFWRRYGPTNETFLSIPIFRRPHRAVEDVNELSEHAAICG